MPTPCLFAADLIEDDHDNKLKHLLIPSDVTDQQRPQPKREHFDYFIKLASMISSSCLGYFLQLSANSSPINYYYSLLLFVGVVATLWQAWGVSVHFRVELSSLGVFVWLAASLLSFQNGLFFSWNVTDYYYWLMMAKNRVTSHFIVVELLCLVKFLGVTGIVICGAPDDTSVRRRTVVQHNEATMTAPKSDYHLKFGTLVVAYLLGYCSELTGAFIISSSSCVTFLFMGGTILTAFQAWITSRWFVSKRGHGHLILWVSATVMCYLAGFYCAWSLTDYILGMPRQFLVHIALEVMCIGMSVVATWIDLGTSCNDKDEISVTKESLIDL